MRKDYAVTTAQILEKVKDSVAPLPSQKEYMQNLATILAMHINRNLLIDDGMHRMTFLHHLQSL